MIYYSKPGITEGIDLTKSKDSKECRVCHYWYFNHGFKFQKSVFNGCHDLLMMSPDINNVAVTSIKSVDFHCIIYGVSNSVAVHLLENSVLNGCGFT